MHIWASLRSAHPLSVEKTKSIGNWRNRDPNPEWYCISPGLYLVTPKLSVRLDNTFCMHSLRLVAMAKIFVKQIKHFC